MIGLHVATRRPEHPRPGMPRAAEWHPPELRSPVRALSLNGLRRQVEGHFAGQDLDIRLVLDRAAERDGQRKGGEQSRLSDRVDEKTTAMTARKIPHPAAKRRAKTPDAVRKIPHPPAARPGRRRSKRPPRRHRNGFKRTAALDE